MLFVRQERLLRISYGQEMLQAIRPKLPAKLSEYNEGKQVASIFINRAFQMAYFISKSSRSSHVLIQEPTVKHENTAENEDESQFLYTALRPAHSALILVPEPFDPNNSVALPEFFETEIE